MGRYKILSSRKGQGITEYILILALIAMIVFAVVRTFGTNVKTVFSKAADKVTDAGSGW